ncbi:unnamed protein product [Blepharisma stoltei]|uniref:Uncharacterized protein n=1 Tax=Blepharisma stoltei TaxID=1481888 RepID=A0AAU9K0Q4_9CILI|nr:unnamed protein product [Blepharisma stoltei]
MSIPDETSKETPPNPSIYLNFIQLRKLPEAENEVEEEALFVYQNKQKENGSEGSEIFARLEDVKAFNIRPRFDSAAITEAIETKIQEIKNTPLDYYEIVLYELCKKFNLELSSSCLSSKSISKIHHVYRLKSMEDELSISQRNSLNANLEAILDSHPRTYNEYILFAETLKFISAMAIKWGIVSIDNYAYRVTGRGLNVKLLDLKEINNDIFTMETLWLALMVYREPLSKIADDQVNQYAMLLNDTICKLVNEFLSLNRNCDFEAVKSIAGLVASKNPEVTKYTGVEPDYNSTLVEYQRLKLKRGVWSLCLSKNDVNLIKSIKELLTDFEIVYRQFERSLMTNLLMAFHGNNS